MIIYSFMIVTKNILRNKVIKNVKDVIIHNVAKLTKRTTDKGYGSFTIIDNKDFRDLSFFIDFYKNVSCDDILERMRPITKEVEDITNISIKLYLTAKII